jgi:hypothetical protein
MVVHNLEKALTLFCVHFMLSSIFESISYLWYKYRFLIAFCSDSKVLVKKNANFKEIEKNMAKNDIQ